MHPLARSIVFTLVLYPALLHALDEAKLAAIHPAMEAAVQAKQAAGIVTLVMEKGKIVHHAAAGMADVAKGRTMEKDALFWIASMTKSVNATAIMVLVDEGKLALDEPASKWLPELAKVKLADGSAPEKPITLRMLLSHTAGIAFPSRKPTDGAISLKAYVATLIKTPLAFQPGSAYEYGFGPTVAGHILEIASGMKYDAFLKAKLFGPLGMQDTLFNPDDAHRARIARTYKMDDETHELAPGYNPFVTSEASVTHMVEPSGGLFSTAADMGRFYAMIANSGELDGTRILSEKAVRDMTTPVTAGGKPLNYACGWQVNIQAQRVNAQMPVGSFGHGGAFATNGCIDPQSKIVTVFMVQNVLVPDSGRPKDAFQHLVMEAAGIQVVSPPVAKKKDK
ncbi:serine hydrolase domain-containing protein [Prosthecobacter sp.]|uniref:serine hydrolase domain-containing protein n=1 Tax=Prosthecobacter sp. TaxID=1965333 RepID=UPI002ABAECEE|nr:serine hydrolase domain-containing protein [Prosthecobacter sp.]MDZ4405444.1 serine hydrolase domain-containing protein [Prosthecobacter sp.]